MKPVYIKCAPALIALCCILFAERTSSQELPHYTTPAEKQLLNNYQAPYSFEESRSYSSSFTPPVNALRTMAEWEEVQGYLITWRSYNSMLREIVRYGKQECRMYIVTTNAQNVRTELANNGIDTANITFLNTASNSVWSRDYGQWCAYAHEVDSLVFIDWIYNRPRPSDDTVPSGLARLINVPVYHTTQSPNALVHTGGNFMCDGMGTGFSSKLILTDNQLSAGFGVSHTEAEIDTIMSKFMGIIRYVKVETLPYDDIHHIDMHIKLLDEETLLVGEYPQGIADGPQIEANLQYILSNHKTTFGTDYRVVRIPMPADNGKFPHTGGDYFTYTNASFINKTIIVPTYNIPIDTTALRIWREACPGYNVVGINSTSSISALGALHCITKEIGTADPLLITHQRLRDTYNTSIPYTATANIKHRSGIQSAILKYALNTSLTYNSVAMTAGSNDNWHADIPPQPTGTQISYFIDAQANSGKQQVRPITAPDGYYRFSVLGTGTGVTDDSGRMTEVKPIFPNPSKGITCLPVSTATPHKISIACFDLLGQNIKHIFDGETNTGDNNYFINTSQMAAGVYLIKYNLAGEEVTKRLVVR